MELHEKLARAGHAAVLDWVEEDNPHPMFKPWDDLSEGERADLIFAAEFELLNPSNYDKTVYHGEETPTQVFLEGLFRGTVRTQYEIMQHNAKEQ